MKKLLSFFCAFFLVYSAFCFDRPIVTDITATGGKGNKISVSWKVPSKTNPEIQKLFVYRSSRPIGTYYDISSALQIAVLSSTEEAFADTVKNYNEYYYAVIAQVNNGKYDIILPSVNATVNGARLKLPEKKTSETLSESAKEKLVPPDALRETPLPFLDITEQFSRKPVQMGQKAKNTAKELAGIYEAKNTRVLEPYIFEEDLISPEGGDDFLLFEILRTTFIQKKYKESEEQLTKLLGTNRSKSVTKRATFYLGESQFYTKNYNNAVRTFLQVYDDYPIQTKKWIDASLEKVELVD